MSYGTSLADMCRQAAGVAPAAPSQTPRAPPWDERVPLSGSHRLNDSHRSLAASFVRASDRLQMRLCVEGGERTPALDVAVR
jgi:hypothetical protein